jgi:hypothetical protein
MLAGLQAEICNRDLPNRSRSGNHSATTFGTGGQGSKLNIPRKKKDKEVMSVTKKSDTVCMYRLSTNPLC